VRELPFGHTIEHVVDLCRKITPANLVDPLSDERADASTHIGLGDHLHSVAVSLTGYCVAASVTSKETVSAAIDAYRLPGDACEMSAPMNMIAAEKPLLLEAALGIAWDVQPPSFALTFIRTFK
jgi:hypothetical protein